MELADVMKKECMCILKGETKDDVLVELIELLVKAGEIRDIERTRDKIFYRENLMSTGIGLGIGIPHVRIEGIDHPIVAIGISKDGISDYESLDDDIVWIVIMIVAGKDQHNEYIMLMSRIISKMKGGNTLDSLMEADTAEEIYDIFAANGDG